MAAAYGASFLCYVTPAEHLSLPDVDDVKEGIIASKIAAHAADIAKGVKGAMDWDHQMAVARGNLDWERMFALAMDPERTVPSLHRSVRIHAPCAGKCVLSAI